MKGDKETLKLMRERTAHVVFTHEELLFLHAFTALNLFGDKRTKVGKIMYNRLVPVALDIIKNTKEYRE